MATPELILQVLARTTSPAPLLSPQTQEKHGNVVEFDPGGNKSRSYEAQQSLPTDLLGPSGFTFDGVRAGTRHPGRTLKTLGGSESDADGGVYFHVKDFDNSQAQTKYRPSREERLAPLCDRRVRGFVVVLAAFGPRAALRQSGYRLEQLSKQQRSLKEVNHQLTMRQAMLSDVRRVTALAEARGLATPPPERYAWQNRTIAPLMGSSEWRAITRRPALTGLPASP